MAGVGGATHWSGGYRAGGSPWADGTKDEQLRAVWGTMPVAEIAFKLRMTKNQIAGRAHRLHLPPYPNPVRRDGTKIPKPPPPTKGKAERDAAFARARTTAPTIVVRAPTPRRVPFVYAPVRECRWPTSDGKPWKFCEAPTLPGKDYCAEHHAISFQKHRTKHELQAEVGDD